MFESPEQRRAAFAHMAKEQHRYFPLRGKTMRARGNRALVALGVGGSTAAGLVLATHAGRRTGPFRSLFGVTGEVQPGSAVVHVGQRASWARDLVPHDPARLDRMWTYHAGGRAASPGEEQLARMLHRISPTLRRKLGFRRLGAGRAWEVGTEPLDARIRPALKRKIERKIERASLWRITGNPGQLLDDIEIHALHAQDAAKKATKRALTHYAEAVETPVGTTIGTHLLRPFQFADRHASNLVRFLGRQLLRTV